MQHLNMKNIDEIPESIGIKTDTWTCPDEQRAAILSNTSKRIVLHYFNLGHLPGQHRAIPHRYDTVNAYASEVFTLGLLYMELCDSIKEGDGDRIMGMWKYLLPLFKATKNKNYAIERLSGLQNGYWWTWCK